MDFDALYAKSDDPWSHDLRISLQEYDQRYLRIIAHYVESPSMILEIACGNGKFSEKLAYHYFNSKIDACDISRRAVNICKNRCKEIVNFFVDKMPELENVKHQYDLIVLNEALSYLDGYDRKMTICRIRDLCIPKGYFFISSNIGKNYFQESDLTSLLESGFGKIVHVERNYNLFYYKIVEKPILKVLSIVTTAVKKYPWMNFIKHPIDAVSKFLLRNRLLFQFLQGISERVLKAHGVTNIYILAIKNE